MAASKRNTWLDWRGSTLPLPSAFALLAVPARLGCWGRTQLGELLQRRLHSGSQQFLGWKALSHYDTLDRISCALHRRPEAVRLGAELHRWWPPALRPLLRDQDPTTFDSLRFCRLCLERGDHSPLFQLPWWDGCPIHAEPLCEGCPQCQGPIPAGLPHARPAEWLKCPNCAADLSDRARLAHLHQHPARQDNSRWWQVLAAYRRWLRACQRAQWPVPWEVRGEGSFAEIARLAAQHLVTTVPVPAELYRHLRSATPTRAPAAARSWSRTFIERPKRPRVQELEFDSRRAMVKAGRRFYGALPISEGCRRALASSERHLRRHLKVRLIGRGSPQAQPDSVAYAWHGRRPLAVMAFRLLTGLAQTDRVDDVAYLDFRAVELLLEPPVILAHSVLARWTGVDLREQHKWPDDLCTLSVEPLWMLSARAIESEVRRDRFPRGALGWLYDRLVLEAWQDLALECFCRARPGGVMAWTVGPGSSLRSNRERNVYVPIYAESSATDVHHPLLVHARADRERPRGWAVAVMRTSVDQREAYVALLGRAAPQPFAPPCVPSFQAHWTRPQETDPAPEPA